MKTPLLFFAGLLAASPVVAQSFAITGLLPARNAMARVSADINVTFSQPLSPTSTRAVRVFSSQRHGLLPGQALVMGNILVFNPHSGFRSGEVVSATVTTAAQSSSGTALATPQVFQFRAATYGGTGVLSGGSEVATGDTPLRVAMADIDNDGDVDLLAPNYGGNTVSVRVNNGRGVFTGTTEIPVGANPRAVATGDIDADGDLDFLVTDDSGGFSGGNVNVRVNNGSGGFTAPAGTGTIPVGGSGPQVVTLADVDGDGDLDMLVTNFQNLATTGSSVSVRLNNGAGVFGGGSDVQLPSGAIGLAVGDIDNDGDLDFLTSNFNTGLVSVQLNNGRGSFSAAANVTVGLAVVALTLGDLDNDGDLDLLVTNADNGGPMSVVQVRLNNGNGSFSSSPDVLTGGSLTQSLVTADMDGDGDLDLLTATNTSSTGNELGIWLNNGSAQFSRVYSTPLGAHLIGLTVADVDEDGDLDCIASLDNGLPTGRVSIRLNNGTGPVLATAKARPAAVLRPAPNPAHDEARLTVSAGTREVVVLSALGQRLRTVAVPAGASEARLPLAGLSAGVYLVQAGAAVGRLVVE